MYIAKVYCQLNLVIIDHAQKNVSNNILCLCFFKLANSRQAVMVSEVQKKNLCKTLSCKTSAKNVLTLGANLQIQFKYVCER